MKLRFFVGAIARSILITGLFVGLAAETAISQSKKTFGTKADIDYGNDLWKALLQSKLAGSDAIMSHFYKGDEPHGFVLETLDTKIKVRGHTGAVIVKRNYGPEGVTIKQVIADPKKHLAWITVMFKREKGFDAANKDWFWAKYSANGGYDKHIVTKTPLVGKVGSRNSGGGCIGCHTGADPDMVLDRKSVV